MFSECFDEYSEINEWINKWEFNILIERYLKKKNEIYFNFLFASANNVPYFRLLNPNRAIVIIHIILVCGSNSEDDFFLRNISAKHTVFDIDNGNIFSCVSESIS